LLDIVEAVGRCNYLSKLRLASLHVVCDSYALHLHSNTLSAFDGNIVGWMCKKLKVKPADSD
jgi:hypothetical protein